MGRPKIAACGDELHLLNRCCIAIMQEIAPGRVAAHTGWKWHIAWEDAAAQQIAVSAEPSPAGGWHLGAFLGPGDSIIQARRLYTSIDAKRLLALTECGWDIKPNFHLAHMQKNLIWTTATMPLADYVAYWQEQQRFSNIGQVEIVDKDAFWRDVDKWQRIGLIVEADRAKIVDKFLNTKRTRVNVCPGLNVIFRWDSATAIDMDNRSCLSQDVKTKIQDALATWNQPWESQAISI